jgi:hypothetical protein
MQCAPKRTTLNEQNIYRRSLPNYSQSSAALLDPARVQPGTEWWASQTARAYPPAENKAAKARFFERAVARAAVAPLRVEQWGAANPTVHLLGNRYLRNESVVVPDEHGNPKRRLQLMPHNAKVLAKARVLGLYFARAPVTGVADQEAHERTAELTGLYSSVRSRGGASALEIVFVSMDRDRANWELMFRAMPWLALPFSREEGEAAAMARNIALASSFAVHSLPALVLVEGDTGRLITSAGLPQMLGDPEGTRGFPWLPPLLRNLLEYEPPRARQSKKQAAAAAAAGLTKVAGGAGARQGGGGGGGSSSGNSSNGEQELLDPRTAARVALARQQELLEALGHGYCVVLFMEGADKRAQRRAAEALEPLSAALRERRAAQPGAHPLVEWFVATRESELGATLRRALGLPPAPAPGSAAVACSAGRRGSCELTIGGAEPLLVLLDVKGGGRCYGAPQKVAAALFRARDAARGVSWVGRLVKAADKSVIRTLKRWSHGHGAKAKPAVLRAVASRVALGTRLAAAPFSGGGGHRVSSARASAPPDGNGGAVAAAEGTTRPSWLKGLAANAAAQRVTRLGQRAAKKRRGHIFDDGEEVRRWVFKGIAQEIPHKQMAGWGTRLFYSTGVPHDKSASGVCTGLMPSAFD